MIYRPIFCTVCHILRILKLVPFPLNLGKWVKKTRNA